MAYIISNSTYYSSTATGSFNVTLPDDIVSGDVIYALMTKRVSTGSTVFTQPSGWSLEGTMLSQSNGKAQWSYKVSAGTEAGTLVTFTGNTTAYWTVIIIIVRDADTTATPHVYSGGTYYSPNGALEPLLTVDGSSNGSDQLVLYHGTAYAISSHLLPPIEDVTQLVTANNLNSTHSVWVGYDVMSVAGVTPSIGIYSPNQGTKSVLAIKNASSGIVQPRVTQATDETLIIGNSAADVFDFSDRVTSLVSYTVSSSTDLVSVSPGHGLADGDYICPVSPDSGGGVGFGAGKTYVVSGLVGDTFYVKKYENEPTLNFTANISSYTLGKCLFFDSDDSIAATIDGINTSGYKHHILAGAESLECTTTYDPLAAAGEFVGFTSVFTAKDFTGKVLAFQYINEQPTDFFGDKGFVIVFGDSSGNWNAFQAANRDNAIHTTKDTFIISPATGTILDSSGTVDYTDITKISFLFHRAPNNSNPQYFRISNVYSIQKAIIVGGGVSAPVTLQELNNKFSPNQGNKYVQLQGTGQYLKKFGVQLGDGVNETHFYAAASSLETPSAYILKHENKHQWNVGDQDIALTIKASAADSYNFANSIVASDTFQYFTVDAASSLSATYIFTGCNFVGRTVEWKSGVNITGANVSSCKALVHNSASLSGATISNVVTGETASIADITSETMFDDVVTDAIFKDNTNAPAIRITGDQTGSWSDPNLTVYGNTYDIEYTGTTDFSIQSANALTVNNSSTGTLTVVTPTVSLVINSDVTALIRYFEDDSQTIVGSTTGVTLSYTYPDDDPMDIEVLKQGYVPVNRQDVVPYNGDYDITLDYDEAYNSSHGLVITTDYTYNRTTKVLSISADQEALDVRSSLADAIRTNSSYYNTPLLMDVIGGLVRIDLIGGMTCSDMSTWKGTGSEVYAAADSANPIEKWCAVKTVGVITDSTTHYRQIDSGASTAVALTSNVVNEAFQYWSDPDHDGVATTDTSNYLLIKSFLAGSKQGRIDILTASGDSALRSTLYQVGLANESHDYAGTDPGITVDITLVTGGTVGGKVFAYEIVDGGTNSGTDIADQLNYNAANNPNTVIAGGTGLRYFELPDMVIYNASAVETEYGYEEGNTPTLVGFYVSRSSADHPDFTRFQADDGTYYVKPVLANISITNLPDGIGGDTRLHVYNVTTDKVIYSGDPTGTGYSTSYTNGHVDYASSGDSIRIRFAHLDAGTSFEYGETIVTASTDGITADGSNFISADTIYAINSVDGSAVTVFTADYAGDEIEIATDTDFIAAQFYAFYCYTLTDATGITGFWNGITANDTGNYLINNSVVDIYFNSPTGVTYTVKQTDSARIYRADSAYPVKDPSTSGYGVQINWKSQVFVVTTGGSALTASEQAQLTAVESKTSGLNYTITGEVNANAKSMNDTEIVGGSGDTDLFRSINE